MKKKHSYLYSSTYESSEQKCFQAECFSKLFKRCQQQFNISEVSLKTEISGKVACHKFKWSKQEEECFIKPTKKKMCLNSVWVDQCPADFVWNHSSKTLCRPD